jgi:predicted RNase H-like HicB family nuclease
LEKKKFVYYQENDMWVGWLEEYPDYRTQGITLDELKENLIDIWFPNLFPGTAKLLRA